MLEVRGCGGVGLVLVLEFNGGRGDRGMYGSDGSFWPVDGGGEAEVNFLSPIECRGAFANRQLNGWVQTHLDLSHLRLI